MNQELVSQITNKVIEQLEEEELIPIEASARHVHLSREDLEGLFGSGYQLTPERELSQPGQFLAEEKVRLIGPKEVFDGVAVLGPPRDKTQVEISRTDAFRLGVSPPLRYSGNTADSESIVIGSRDSVIEIETGVIIAKRHLHMTPEDAEELGVEDGQRVKIKVLSDRPVIFDDVLVRVSKDYKLKLHLDFDEANAAAVEQETRGRIID